MQLTGPFGGPSPSALFHSSIVSTKKIQVKLPLLDLHLYPRYNKSWIWNDKGSVGYQPAEPLLKISAGCSRTVPNKIDCEPIA
jgi:hypothetical protein